MSISAASFKRGVITVIICFLVLMTITRTEFPGAAEGAGMAALLRVFFTMLLVGVMVLVTRAGFSFYALVFAALVVTYMLLVNIVDPTIFGTMVSLGMFGGILIAYVGLGPGRQLLLGAIRFYMWLNVIGLCVAGMYYLKTHELLDLHGMLFPWSKARVQVFMGYPRMTGFQVEPGTYSNTMFLLAMISGALRGRLSGRIEIIAVVSTLFTFSAWAALGTAFFLIGVCLQAFWAGSSRGRSWTVVLLLLIIALSPLAVTLTDNPYVQYYIARFNTDDGSGSINEKVMAWEAWKSYLWMPMMFGHALPNGFCKVCGSPQDLGTGLNLIYNFGFLATIPLIGFVTIGFGRQLGWSYVLASVPLMTAKFYMYDPVIWVYLAMGMFMYIFSRGLTRKSSSFIDTG